MDLSRAYILKRCGHRHQFLIVVIVFIFFLIYIIKQQYICEDLDIHNINDRYMRKLAFVGKDPQDTDCEQKFPSCIIIGVMKGGTEAFSTFLALHPQVAMQFKMQATLFFTNVNYRKGTSWYRNQMPCSSADQITIEKSPQYWAAKNAPERVHKLNPNMKLIIVVREPVERAISHYLQLNTSHPERINNKSFEELVTDRNGNINTNNKIIHVSSYATIIKQWLMYFKQEQILIIDGKKFQENPVHELERAEQFLNLNSYIKRDMFLYNEQRQIYCIKSKCGNEFCLPHGKGREHPTINTKLLQKLKEYFAPLNKEFSSMYGQPLNW